MAAFRMKQRGLVMHEKLDKAAVREAWMLVCVSVCCIAGASFRAASWPCSIAAGPACPTRTPASQVEKLRLAAEMLPPQEACQKAARLVEQAMQAAPWTLTDAFVAHFRWVTCGLASARWGR